MQSSFYAAKRLRIVADLIGSPLMLVLPSSNLLFAEPSPYPAKAEPTPCRMSQLGVLPGPDLVPTPFWLPRMLTCGRRPIESRIWETRLVPLPWQADASIGCNLRGGVRARVITRCHLKGTADTKRLKFSSVVFRGRVFAISTLADAYDLGDIEKFINAILTMLRRKKT
ncbi:hypothetical protein [Agrobacterium tumefaciens]|uniref:hypothetical protein n=1 Tax=Agrobacterium tumefaciens TaxID=358 RepID=UPI001573AC17|nr:hypothetical protein [Agrobacterium tumefaciens]NTA19240.1 hypothetical protein [Agrobacterium tumefaciens]WCK74729.1 hypothetical protein G6L96_025025 [Agrobacterium tumefaciens]